MSAMHTLLPYTTAIEYDTETAEPEIARVLIIDFHSDQIYYGEVRITHVQDMPPTERELRGIAASAAKNGVFVARNQPVRAGDLK